MSNAFAKLETLANLYGVPIGDALLIAFNYYGLKNASQSSRTRFKFSLHNPSNDWFYFIVSTNRKNSPFELRGDNVFLDGIAIGIVEVAEMDDAVMSYFRRGRRELTLNTNSRSQCTGCAFCYTSLQERSDPRLSAEQEVEMYLSVLEADQSWIDLSPLNAITICTGCFHSEERAVDHLMSMDRIFEKRNFRGRMHFLSSVLRTGAAVKALAEKIPDFHLTITLECFSSRESLLKQSKASLTVDTMKYVMDVAASAGMLVDFTYIVGIDAYDEFERQMEKILPLANTFPRFQIFQPHNPFMDLLEPQGQDPLENFFRTRKWIEAVVPPEKMMPRSWENYRPLWYYQYGGSPVSKLRI